MAPKKKVITAAAIYCRISDDRKGEALGVKRQEELCGKLAAEKGWIVAETYTDNDKSAYSGKLRPAYQRMLSDLEAGVRDAVICVDLDRLTRRPGELESFMELADARGIALANVSGDTDLSTSDGRFRARIMGAVARQESEKKSERIAREAEQAARRGVYRAPQRPFGFEAPYAIDGEVFDWRPAKTSIQLRQDEAKLIREAVRRVLDGETTAAVARDWNRRGIRTIQSGREWAAATINSVLRSPRIAALRDYRGEIVAEGNWPAIIDRATWETLRARIRRVARVGRPPAHLLAGIAVCGRCRAPLYSSMKVTPTKKVRRYGCMKSPGGRGCGICGIIADPFEAIVKEAVIKALTGPKFTRALKRARTTGNAEARASRELVNAEERLEMLAADFASGAIGRREWIVARDRVNECIVKARRALDSFGGVPADVPRSEKALRAKWEAEETSMEWRRAVISSVVEAVVVNEGARGRFDPNRIGFDWRV
jgi:site-specific DNA recombinase